MAKGSFDLIRALEKKGFDNEFYLNEYYGTLHNRLSLGDVWVDVCCEPYHGVPTHVLVSDSHGLYESYPYGRAAYNAAMRSYKQHR